MRLGIYVDLDYRRTARGISADQPVTRFLTGLGEFGVEPVFFGRLYDSDQDLPYPLPSDTELVALPHYGSLADIRSVTGALRNSIREFKQALDDLDAVWLFGPHPLSFAFATTARRCGVPVFLGVRQDFPRYVANRFSRRARTWAMPVAWTAEFGYRQMARKLPTVVVGEDLASRYRAQTRPVLSTGFSLIRETDVISDEMALARVWDGERRLLSVGRLAPEKNPLLLPEILADLRAEDRGWRLTVAGDGPMMDTVAERASELGVRDAIEMLGHVPNGPALRDLYRDCHAFLHVSLTEGLPQVLFEAHAAGLPLVATDVGGVRSGLDGGQTGLLVPPSDAQAAAVALRRLRDDSDLRDGLIQKGLKRARDDTFESQARRIVSFFRNHLDQS